MIGFEIERISNSGNHLIRVFMKKLKLIVLRKLILFKEMKKSDNYFVIFRLPDL